MRSREEEDYATDKTVVELVADKIAKKPHLRGLDVAEKRRRGIKEKAGDEDAEEKVGSGSERLERETTVNRRGSGKGKKKGIKKGGGSEIRKEG